MASRFIVRDTSWQDRGNCASRDPEMFYPEKGSSAAKAKQVCTGCPVQLECLEYALANDEHFGIWGGLSERERRELKRERRKRATANRAEQETAA